MVKFDFNSNVTSNQTPLDDVKTDSSVDMEGLARAKSLGCKRITSTYNCIFLITGIMLLVLIFVVRWFCFNTALKLEEKRLTLGDDLGNMTGKDLDDFNRIWQRAYQFGDVFFVIEILLTISLFLFMTLAQRYVVEIVWKVKTGLLNETSLVIAVCSLFFLQFIFFEIHDVVILELSRLGTQTRLRIFATKMIHGIGAQVADITSVDDIPGVQKYMALLVAKAEVVYDGLMGGVLDNY